MDSKLGSVSPSPSSVAAIEQDDSSSSPQTDTDSRNEGEIGDTISPLTPSLRLRFPSIPFSDDHSREQVVPNHCGTQARVDENITQLDPPSVASHGTGASQSPQFVQRDSQSRFIRTQSAPSVVQNNFVYSTFIISNVRNVGGIFRNVSEVSTNVSQLFNTFSQLSTPANSAAPQRYQQHPTTQTPQTPRTSGNVPAPRRTSGEGLNSESDEEEHPSSPTFQQYTTPFQQYPPTTPSMYSGIPPQPYGPSQSVERPQLHSSSPTHPSIVPAQSPRTYGERWRSSSRIPQQYRTPLQQSVPTTPSMLSGIPSHPYGPSRSVERPQPLSSRLTTFPSQSRVPTTPPMHSGSYHRPVVPTPQAHSMYVGQPFMSQTSGPPFSHILFRNHLQAGPYPDPAAQNSMGQTTTPQPYRNFVASDPFRATHRNEQVDDASDGLTFDDITTAPRRSQFCGIPRMPTQSRFGRLAMPTPQTTQPIDTGMAMRTPQPFVHQPATLFCYFFLVDFLEKIYFYLLLLQLPSLYFYRVAQIFEKADMSLSEIKRMALETFSEEQTHQDQMEVVFGSSSVPDAYKRLATTWESFINSVMQEWKAFNIVSAVLFAGTLAILQIASDPLVYYTALGSLMCSLISLLFGGMYTIQFGNMRKSYKGAQWALETKKARPLIWWNVWIMLAMPAIWLLWSILLLIVCIMSLIWRRGATSTTPPGLSDTGLLVIRIVMTVVPGIGFMLYGSLILATFKQYGRVMDEKWMLRVDGWFEDERKKTSKELGHPWPTSTSG